MGNRIKLTQPNSMILVSISSVEDALFNDVKNYDTSRSQGTENPPFRFFGTIHTFFFCTWIGLAAAALCYPVVSLDLPWSPRDQSSPSPPVWWRCPAALGSSARNAQRKAPQSAHKKKIIELTILQLLVPQANIHVVTDIIQYWNVIIKRKRVMVKLNRNCIQINLSIRFQ